MNTIKKYIFIISISILYPLSTFAQRPRGLDTSFFVNLINGAQGIVSLLFPLLITIAVLIFFYGLINFMYKKEDPTAKKEYLHFMWYGLLSIFIMVSIWGLIRLLGNLTGIGAGGNINASIPCVLDVRPEIPGCQF